MLERYSVNLQGVFRALLKISLPVISLVFIGFLLSIDAFDEVFGELPDPGCPMEIVAKEDGPVFDIWYGPHQSFGEMGLPQQWVNLLGNVGAPSGIKSLAYSLNNQELKHLNVGPDERRLACEGDFNIEIPYINLGPGENLVDIRAVDNDGNTTNETVRITFFDGRVWPNPYAVHWGALQRLEDAVQVVDGRWYLDERGIRPGTISYDRIIALGDLSWKDYEITVPFFIHRIDPTNSPSNGAGLGIVIRWRGHTDMPIACDQPGCGWWNSGATAWYGWDETGSSDSLTLSGYKDKALDEYDRLELRMNKWYSLKMRVESSPGDEVYRLKLWEIEDPEPNSWLLSGSQIELGPPSGSVLLVAHHVDVTFGDITVIPLP